MGWIHCFRIGIKVPIPNINTSIMIRPEISGIYNLSDLLQCPTLNTGGKLYEECLGKKVREKQSRWDRHIMLENMFAMNAHKFRVVLICQIPPELCLKWLMQWFVEISKLLGNELAWVLEAVLNKFIQEEYSISVIKPWAIPKWHIFGSSAYLAWAVLPTRPVKFCSLRRKKQISI